MENCFLTLMCSCSVVYSLKEILFYFNCVLSFFVLLCIILQNVKHFLEHTSALNDRKSLESLAYLRQGYDQFIHWS